MTALNNAVRHATDGFIGILDMFGFEDPKPSQLEHLCINLCAETMQHFYNTHIFKSSIESCRDEGIRCDVEVDYVDNVPCIDLISSLVSVSARSISTRNRMIATDFSLLCFAEDRAVEHVGRGMLDTRHGRELRGESEGPTQAESTIVRAEDRGLQVLRDPTFRWQGHLRRLRLLG